MLNGEHADYRLTLRMGALRELARALRGTYTDESALIQLSEIIQFIQKHAETSAPQKTTKNTENPTNNAEKTRKNTLDDAPRTTTNTKQRERALPGRERAPQGTPSYAEAAKRGVVPTRKSAKSTEKSTQKPVVLPQSLKNSQKQPKAIKITLRSPLRETPSELIAKIRVHEGGESIISLIKAIRPLNNYHLLIYPRDERAEETLRGTRE